MELDRHAIVIVCLCGCTREQVTAVNASGVNHYGLNEHNDNKHNQIAS